MFVSPAPTAARVAGIHWWVVWMCVCRYEMACPFEVDEPVYNSLLHPVIKVCKCVALWTISKKLILTQHKHKITFNKDTNSHLNGIRKFWQCGIIFLKNGMQMCMYI